MRAQRRCAPTGEARNGQLALAQETVDELMQRFETLGYDS
jgi:hypothetical protein